MMKLMVYVISLLLAFITDTLQKNVQLPDVYWHPDEPMFNTKHCLPASTTIYVKEFDAMSVICPNRDLNNAILDKKSPGVASYSFNLLMTEHEELFTGRRKSIGDKKAEKIFSCRDEKTLSQNGLHISVIEKYRIQFSPIRASSNQPEFKAGHTYYFYTTSNGTEASLELDIGSDSTRHMFFKVKVCTKDDQICYDREERINRCIERKQIRQPQIANGLYDDRGVDWEMLVPVLLILFLVVGILIGALTPAFIGYIKNKRNTSPHLKTQESVSAVLEKDASTIPSNEQTVFLQPSEKC